MSEIFYTVVYEGNPNDTRILSGEPASGRAVTVGVGDRITENMQMREALRDPIAVHRNMLAGAIANPSPANILHLYGVDAIRAALAEHDARLPPQADRPA